VGALPLGSVPVLIEHDVDRLLVWANRKASTGDQVLVALVEAISRASRHYASLIAFRL
jgi:hypothetical protein